MRPRAFGAAAVLIALMVVEAAPTALERSDERRGQSGATVGPPVSLVLVLDTSDSLRFGQYEDFGTSLRRTPAGLPQTIAAARTLIGLLRPDDDVTLLTFADRITLDAPATTSHEVVLRALDAAATAPAAPHARSVVYDALTAGVTFAAARPHRAAVILLGDGMDNGSWFDLKPVADYAARAGVVIDVVSVPRTRDTRDLTSPMLAEDAATALRRVAGQSTEASDRRLADRLTERLRLLRFSPRAPGGKVPF